MSLLEVRNWKLGVQGDDEILSVLNGINLYVEQGTTVGLVGESGTGKSVTGLSIMGLLPNNAKIQSGEIFFDLKRIAPASEEQLRKLRGDKISMIFQDPVGSLNPAFTVEFQLSETLNIHQGISGASLRERCLDLLRMVGIPDPQARLSAY